MRIRNSLFKRLLLYFMVISLLPLTITGFIATRKLDKTIRDDSRKYEQLICSQIAYTFDHWLDASERDSFQYINQDSVQDYLSGKDDDAMAYRAYALSMSRVWAGNSDLADVAFCKMDGTVDSLHIIGNTNAATMYGDARKYLGKDKYELLMKDDGKDVYWFSDAAFQFDKNNSNTGAFQDTISMCRKVISLNTGEMIGLLVWHFFAESITNQYGQGLAPDCCVVIVNEEGKIVNPNGVLNGMNSLDEALLGRITGEQGDFVADVLDERYCINYAVSPKTGWRVISLMPENEVVRPVRQTTVMMFALIALIAFFIVVLAILFSRMVVRPIQGLTNAIESIDYDSLTPEEILITDDEVGRLARCFYDMCSRLEKLIRQREQDSTLLQKAELRALQSQINPHFLYNTLDNVIWIAKEHHEKEIESILIALSRFYRISLSNGMAEIPFSMEVEHLQYYFSLLFTRESQKRFSVEYDIAPETRDIMIQKIILQPLVENSIKHGFGNMDTRGKLLIRSRIKEGHLIIWVIDNGKGFQTAQSTRRLSVEETSGYGIPNVNARLINRYGNDYVLQFEETPGGGTTVIIRIPLGVNGEHGLQGEMTV